MSDTDKEPKKDQGPQVPALPTAEAQQLEVADGVATALQATAEAVSVAIEPPTTELEEREVAKKKLDVQGLALLKVGRIKEFSLLCQQNPNWHLGNCSGADFSGINFTGTDYFGDELNDYSDELTQLHLGHIDFSGANFSGAILYGTYLGGSNFTGANFAGTDLRDTDLGGARLIGANLEKADLGMATLHCSKLTRANLARANLAESCLWDAVLTEADLNYTNLSGAYLFGADLSGVKNLTAKQLRDALLGGVIIAPSQKPLLEEALRLLKESIKVKEE